MQCVFKLFRYVLEIKGPSYLVYRSNMQVFGLPLNRFQRLTSLTYFFALILVLFSEILY